MDKVSSVELQRKFGECRVKALQAGLTVTHHGRDDLVILSADEYRRLKMYDDRQALPVEALSDEDIEAIAKMEIPAESE